MSLEEGGDDGGVGWGGGLVAFESVEMRGRETWTFEGRNSQGTGVPGQ